MQEALATKESYISPFEIPKSAEFFLNKKREIFKSLFSLKLNKTFFLLFIFIIKKHHTKIKYLSLMPFDCLNAASNNNEREKKWNIKYRPMKCAETIAKRLVNTIICNFSAAFFNWTVLEWFISMYLSLWLLFFVQILFFEMSDCLSDKLVLCDNFFLRYVHFAVNICLLV